MDRAWQTSVTAFVIVVMVSLAAIASTRAQSSEKIVRIGLLSPLSAIPEPSTVAAFREGLREQGYVEGKNVILETRYAGGRMEHLPHLVAELIRLKVDVLVVGSSHAALAAKKATTTVPIVFAGMTDPLAAGVVASLARPEGNVTGVTFGVGGTGFGAKWLELLKEAAPDVSHVAALSNLANPIAHNTLRDMQAAARSLRMRVDVFDAGNPATLEKALEAIVRSGARGFVVIGDAFLRVNTSRLVHFAASNRLVGVYFTRDFVEAGGLMSYGSSVAESYRRAAVYVDKILKGMKPADLPVDQPTKYELVINLNAARALGLALPQTLLVRADGVIE